MKRILYLPIAFILIVTSSCGSQQSTVNDEKSSNGQPVLKEFYATMAITDTIKKGDSVLLTFTVYNDTDSTKNFLKWQTPFEPLLSKYLDITDQNGQEVAYKGAMAKRMMPPPADAYIAINAKNNLVINVDLLKGYAIDKPGKYTIAYTSESVSGLKVLKSVSFFYR
jgi:hypothetical protein